ncbi:MAG: tetratricopeptide repeat protein [candidate division Zixibacteria bacterium]|nr:tetratricopeptide repeat protein [candidate division Zixibacteria bacterium]MBU1470678.1 tetratricopeptide repeat protein [candidate division Zixibacteria bacterium]MBU2625016.1 tetratricopeptide repeat protein [candidate division Zixibacteria bacterium]
MKQLCRQSIILASLAIIVLITSCDDIGDQDMFKVERLYYDAEKLEKKKLGIKPELATEADYSEIIKAYQTVVDTYEDSFSGLNEKDSLTENESKVAFLAGKSLLQTAKLYQMSDNIEKTREVLAGYANRFPQNREFKAVALLRLGRLEEDAGNLKAAEEAYLRLLDEFYPPSDMNLQPNTDILELPVRLAGLHKSMENLERTEYFLDYAEEYYKRIIDQYKISPLGFTTVRYLADTYVLRNKPNEAITLLESVTDTTGEIFGSAQLLIGDLYASYLSDTAEARRRFETVANDQADTLLHPKAFIQLAKLQFDEGNFIECRKHIAVIKDRFVKYSALQSEAQQILARTFDRAGDFNRAYSEYQWLITNHPDSKESIEAYRYLPPYLKQNGQDDLAREWYDKAIDYLTAMRDKSTGTYFGLTAQGNLVNIYYDLERWNEVATELQRMQTDYPNSEVSADALVKAGDIYREKLFDPPKARQSYELQLKLYPDLPITEEARKHLSN